MPIGLGAVERSRLITAALVRATMAPMTSAAAAFARYPASGSWTSRTRTARPTDAHTTMVVQRRRGTENVGQSHARRQDHGTVAAERTTVQIEQRLIHEGASHAREADPDEGHGHGRHRMSGTPTCRQLGDLQHEQWDEKRGHQEPDADERVGPVDARRPPGHACPRERGERGRDAAYASPGEPLCDPGGQQGQRDDASENGQPGGLRPRRSEAQGHQMQRRRR